MKILHINSYYSVSKFYKNLYDEQVKRGLDVEVLVPVSYTYNSEFNFGSYTKILKSFNSYDRAVFHLKHSKILKSVSKEILNNNYDVIHAHSLFSNGYIAYKLNQKFNIPYIVAVRNTDLNVFFKKMIHLRKLGINILRNASKIIFLSDAYKSITIEKYVPKKYQIEFSNKSLVIPNGIDDYWLENKYSHESFDSSKINLIQVGQIDKNKNVINTVETIKLLRKEKINATLTVIGKVIDNNIFDKVVQNEFVSYEGTMDKENLIQEYRKHDILIMPSYTETFGLVYAEAMSQGLPVIYTKKQGFDGHFKDGAVGYSVNPNDIQEISEKVKLIVGNYDQISKNCMNVVDRFKWSKIESTYYNIYSDMKEKGVDINV